MCVIEAKIKLKLSDREVRALIRGDGFASKGKERSGFLQGYVKQVLTKQTKYRKADDPK